MSMPLQILSMGKYLPSQPVTAEQLEEKMGLESGWIMGKSGVQVRHFAGPGESNSTMGAKALTQALERAKLKFEDLDLLINASGGIVGYAPVDGFD